MLRDIDRAVAHLFGLLKPGGHLFLSTPNVDGFEHWVGQSRHPQVEPISHLNYFSPKTLQLLLTRHGFTVLDFLTPNGSFDIADLLATASSATAMPISTCSVKFPRQKLQAPTRSPRILPKLISRHRLAGNVVMVAQRLRQTST